MRLLLTISLLGWLACAKAESIRLLLQDSPLAGSQYYALGTVLAELKVGDRLELVREPDNPHDAYAIRVMWHGHMLGYLPRRQNRQIAAAMDAGERLSGRVSSLGDNKNPWQRMAFEVFLEL